MSQTDDARTPTHVDAHVGARIRVRRKTLRLTQEKLADALGITFQQVQKYERGANRISASKLYEVAQFLGTPVSYFFNGLDNLGEGETVGEAQVDREQLMRVFLMTREGLELAATFPKIKPEGPRRRMLDLIASLAAEEKNAP